MAPSLTWRPRKAECSSHCFAGDNILTAVSVAKECGIIAPGEAVVTVTAVPDFKGTRARVFYTSPKDVSPVCFRKQRPIAATRNEVADRISVYFSW